MLLNNLSTLWAHMYMKTYKILIQSILILCLIACLGGCSKKLTAENFAKIQTDMTMQQVVEIIGQPTRMESIDILGIAGTSAVWRSNHAEITIHFVNNAVQIKMFNEIK